MRAFKPSLTLDDAYEWDTDLKDMYGRDPVEVERRLVAYTALYADTPEDPDMTEADDEALCELLEMDWCGAMRQLREEGFESVLGCVRSGNHLESPF